jgi:hypothetical protein
MNTASACWCELLTQAICCPFRFAPAYAGNNKAARMAMIAMTTSNSINVNPRRVRFGGFRDMAAVW